MNKSDGRPAFPKSVSKIENHTGYEYSDNQDGMSLRDWFAGKAMQGIMSNSNYRTWVMSKEDMALISECAYEQSDAMLAEREKETK